MLAGQQLHRIIVKSEKTQGIYSQKQVTSAVNISCNQYVKLLSTCMQESNYNRGFSSTWMGVCVRALLYQCADNDEYSYYPCQ